MAVRHVWPWGVLAVLVIAGAGLRAWDLAARPLWIDEAFTLQGVEHGLVRIATWRHHKEHPPLSYVAVWASTHLLGTSALSLRLPSMLAGLACVVAAFVVARRLAPLFAALVAAALVALDFQMIDQSMQARMYTLYVLLLLLTLAWMLHLLSLPRRRPWHWVLLGVGLFAGLATSGLALITSLAIPLGLLCWHWRSNGAVSSAMEISSATAALMTPLRAPDLPRGLALAVATALVLNLLGWVRLFLRITRGGPGRPAETPEFGRIITDFVHAMSEAMQPPAYGLALLVLGVVGIMVLLRRRHPMGYVLGGIVVLNAVMVLLMRTDYGGLRGRYLIPLQVSLILATAIAVGAVRMRGGRVALAGLVVGLGVWSAVQSMAMPDNGRYALARQVIRLRPQVEPGEWVIYEPFWHDPLGTFHGLPPTQPLAVTERREPIVLPAECPGVWLMISTKHSGGIENHLPLARRLSAHYGLTLDVAEFRRLHSAYFILTLHITPAGVSFFTGH